MIRLVSFSLHPSVWQSIKRAYDVLHDPDEPADVRRTAIHALNQAATYERVIQAVEIQEELNQLEADFPERAGKA